MQLIDVYESPLAPRLLYELLSERDLLRSRDKDQRSFPAGPRRCTG